MFCHVFVQFIGLVLGFYLIDFSIFSLAFRCAFYDSRFELASGNSNNIECVTCGNLDHYSGEHTDFSHPFSIGGYF